MEKLEIVTDKLGNRIIPSIIPITDFVTDNHAPESYKSSANYIYDVNRLIGRQFSDTFVQQDMKMWPFKVVNVCGKPFIAAGPENYVPPEQVSAILLSRLKSMAEELLTVECVRDAIITVPAHFSDAHRQATKDAGEIAGLHVIQVLNEPTAAAYAYGFDDIAGDGYFLVYDLGGGTFDVTILHKVTADHVLKVVTCKGDSRLGGNDFYDRLVQHFCEKGGLDSHNAGLMTLLRYECRKVKHILSDEESTSFKLADVQFEISRKEFEDLCAPFFTRTIDLLSKCLEEAKLDPRGIRDMILVGGSTRIPRIRQLLEEYFSKEVKHSINPDEAVAIGAALRVAVMTGAKSFDHTHGTRLVDVVTHSLGVEMVDGTVDILIGWEFFHQ